MKPRKTILIVLAIGINIIFWEIFIRTFISSPCTQIYDSEFGYVNKPMSPFVYSNEGYSRNHFNSIGFNDNEPLNQSDLRKIILVGDSYSECFQVDRKQSFIQIIEDDFNKQGSKEKIDIVKLARDGFNPADYPGIIDRYFQKIKPDIIILQFWAHSIGDLYSSNILCEYDKKGKIINIKNKISIEDSSKEKLRILINHSAFFYYVAKRFKRIIIDFMQRFKTQHAKPSNSGNQVRSIKDMEKRLVYILNQLNANNIKLIIFYIPEPGIFYKKNIEETTNSLLALKNAAKIMGIDFIDLTKSFKQHYKHSKQPLNGFINTLPGKGHLNTNGHKIVAQKLLTYIKAYFSCKEGMAQ